MPAPNRQHYFAYGSNLNTDDLKRWCERRGKPFPLGRKVAVGHLPDTELVFDYRSVTRGGGALNLRPRKGQLASGVLFEVDARGWDTLDAKEGAPKYHERVDVAGRFGARR